MTPRMPQRSRLLFSLCILTLALGAGCGGDPGLEPTVDTASDDAKRRECSQCRDNVMKLTMAYDGEALAGVVIMQKEPETMVFQAKLLPGEVFSFVGEDKNGTLSDQIFIYVDDELHATIDTGCSTPIGPGLVSGDFKVISGISRSGGELCAVDQKNEAPFCEAGGPFRVTAGERIELDGSESYDPDGKIVRWSWDLGDGRTAEGASITTAFEKGGEAIITLCVTDDDGAVSCCKTVVEVGKPIR